MSGVTRTLLAIIAVSMIACSADDGSAGAHVTLKDYFTELEAISNTTDEKMAEVYREVMEAANAAGSPEQKLEIGRGAVQEMLNISRTTHKDLAALTPPEEVADEHAVLVDNVQAVADALQRLFDEYDDLGIAGMNAELQGEEFQELITQSNENCFALQEIAHDADIAVSLCT